MNQNPNQTNRASSADPTKKVTDEAKQLVTSTTGQVKDLASSAVGQVKQQATKQIDAQKAKAVGKIEGVADAMRAAGDAIDDGPLPDLAARAADGIENLASYFKSRTVGDLLGEVESFGRREPAIFLGAAFALGLLGGRFLKSSSKTKQRMGMRSGEPFEDHFEDDLFDVEEERFRSMRGFDYVDDGVPTAPPARVAVQPVIGVGGSASGGTPRTPTGGGNTGRY